MGIVIGLYIINLFRGLLSPLLSSDLNERLGSTNRACVLSIIGAFNKLVYAGFSIFITFIIENNDFGRAYLITGLLIIIICVPFAIRVHRN